MTAQARDRVIPAAIKHLRDEDGRLPSYEELLAFLTGRRMKRDAAIQLIDEAITTGRVALEMEE